jgi:[ribosomal protein S5]-alanine N-acetyltransferase
MNQEIDAVIETGRLVLRKLVFADAPFILELLNDPAWIRFIGDKGVRTLEDARVYLAQGPIEMYGRFGFGLYLVELKHCRTPIGLCGLIKRDSLEDVDIGFAFLPGFRGKGYAHEAALATLEHGRKVLGLKRIVAITSPDNQISAKLLNKIGLKFSKLVALESGADPVGLFTTDA